MSDASLFLIVIAWMVAAGSPGPATLVISSTAMEHGRAAGLMVASGVLFGSASWGLMAALGISSLMVHYAWLFEFVRHLGAAYLLFLAVKSLRSAVGAGIPNKTAAPKGNLFRRGAIIHILNPKAVISWGSIYAIALPVEAGPVAVAQLFAVLITASAIVFLGYGVLFSGRKISAVYFRLKRWFEFSFSLLFGAASIKMLTSRLEVN